MPEILRPISDVAVNGWTTDTGGTTNLYQAIDEAATSDVDLVRSAIGASSGSYYETALAAGTDPLSSADHEVAYRYQASGAGTTNVVVSLRQGASTEIAAWTHNGISTSVTGQNQTLTGTQADAITNYADLRLRFAPTGAGAATPAAVANSGASTQNKTSQGSTPLTVTSGMASAIQVGHYMVAWVAADNSGGGGARPGLTVTDSRSNSWTVTTGALQDPGTASSGAACYIAYARITTAYQTNDTITFTWGGNTVNKDISVLAFSGVHPTSPVAVAAVQANAASTALQVQITPTAANQLVIACAGIEGPSTDTWTNDSDTTNGSWVANAEVSTGSAGTDTEMTLQGAYKIVSASGQQTWNSTITSRDWTAEAIVLAPDPGSRVQVTWAKFTTPFNPPFNPLTSIIWDEVHWADDPGWTNPGDGNAVSSWRDGSGNSRHATQATGTAQPTFRASEAKLGNKACVQFDGTSDYLTNGTSYTQAQPFSIVVVVSDWATDDVNGARLFSASSTGIQAWKETGIVYAYAGTNVVAAAPFGAFGADTSTTVYTFVYNGASSKCYTMGGGGQALTATLGAGSITSGLTIGARDDATRFSAAKVAFIAVYPGDFSADPSYASFMEWVASNYGLQAPTKALDLGAQIATSGGGTTAISFSGSTKPAVGDTVLVYGGRDSVAGDTLNDSFSDTYGNTYTVINNQAGGAADTAVVAVLAYSKLTAAWPSGTNTLTWTHPSVVARSVLAEAWKNLKGTIRDSALQDVIVGGAVSATLATGQANDLIVAMAAAEWGTDAAPTTIETNATDTSNGQWSPVTFKGNGTASLSGVKVASQSKVLGTTSSQTWDAGGWGSTTDVDVAAIIVAFEPAPLAPAALRALNRAPRPGGNRINANFY